MTVDDVRSIIRVMSADDHAEGRHDLRVIAAGICPTCDRDRRDLGAMPRFRSVCALPSARTIVFDGGPQ